MVKYDHQQFYRQEVRLNIIFSFVGGKTFATGISR